jgi:hypothetical protein
VLRKLYPLEAVASGAYRMELSIPVKLAIERLGSRYVVSLIFFFFFALFF